MSSPSLSAILVFHREQGYVRDTLRSILEQPYRDVEVIAVDNASADHGGELLDELAAADERLSVHRLGPAVSVGEARNAALRAASADYVWFLEPTDRLVPGAVAVAAGRLEETEPDVLLVDHARETPLGVREAAVHARSLRGVPNTGAFELAEHPAVAELAAESGGVILRRLFVGEQGLRFAQGDFGHLTVTYPALLAAARISVVPRPCFTRLDRPPSRPAPVVYGTAFDVFERYDDVFAVGFHADRPAAVRGALPLAMLRHYVTLLDGVPPRRRKEFFARIAESWNRHAGEAPAPRSRRLRFAAAGRYGAFRAFRWAETRRRAFRRRAGSARRTVRRALAVARRALLHGYYRLQLRAPLEPDLAVFAAYWYAAYACNPRAIYEKLRELAPRVRGVWVVDAKHANAFPSGVPHVLAGTRAYYRAIARATYLVNNVNFPNDLVKREGTVHVQTHHGTPLKSMGVDQRGAFVAGTRMNFKLLLRRVARWDYSISSNAFSTVVWERAYPAPYETLEVGYPRNDVLVNATEADVERIRSELGIEPDTRAVLFAPTHREYLRRYVPSVDLARWAAELGPEYVIMQRVHYFYDDDLDLDHRSLAGRVLDVTRHPSVEELCLAADVLVTDYSSIMFDYAVLDRPIVIHAPDWDVYRTLRPTYFDLRAEPPGVVTASDEELVAAFRSGTVWSEHAAELRAAFRARFAYLDDGRASERVVRRIWLSETGEEQGAVESPRPAPAALDA